MKTREIIAAVAAEAVRYVTDIADCICEDDIGTCWYRLTVVEQAEDAIQFALVSLRDGVLAAARGEDEA